MGNRYPEGLEDWIGAHYLEMDLKQLTEECNRIFNYHMTEKAMSSCKKRHKWSGGPRQKVYSDLFPEPVADFIQANYKGTGHRAMCELLMKEFGREYRPEQIKRFYHSHHLNSGLDGHWKKGVPSYNKGKKLSAETYEKIKGTMFKTGNHPLNILPVWTEVINTEGYHKTKIADPDYWEFTHKLVWQQHYGPIPEGMCVSFLDQNKDNLDLDNLILISKSENGYRNASHMISEDSELNMLGINIARVVTTIKNKRSKKK